MLKTRFGLQKKFEVTFIEHMHYFKLIFQIFVQFIKYYYLNAQK
jgi:hypothetical protein